MAEPRLGPEELDRLEDALEGLESLEDLDALAEPSEAVTRRLADFKLILRASREAMPVEEVPAGVLDGVLAEARVSSGDIQARSDRSAQPSFWSRVRRAWLIPGLAVAGSAALVLLLLQPTLRSNEPAEDGSVAVNETRATAKQEAPPAAAAPEAQPVEKVPQADAAPPPPPAASAAEKKSESTRTTPNTVAAENAPAEPEPEPEPSRAEVDKEDASIEGWNAIEEGDKARKGGDCFSARNHYAKALDDGNDSVRARAYVGLGLCKREEGNEAAATEYFDQAGELDQDALEFAGTQNKPKSKPKARRPKKASGSKRKSAIDFDEAKDPFGD